MGSNPFTVDECVGFSEIVEPELSWPATARLVVGAVGGS
jgi:hypothetical protein